MKRILIVGGGTAGKTTALILKTRFPQTTVDIVESTKIGIVGVGEGSTEHWSEFCKFVDISFYEVIRECDATFKIGIYFDNWDDETFMHSILPPYDDESAGYFYTYAHLIANNSPKRSLQPEYAWENKVSLTHFNHENDIPVLQFHFNTQKLNTFLTKKCIERGINIFDDDIVHVDVGNNDRINFVSSDEMKYQYDYYIDSTGFRRLLLHEHLGVKWKSYAEYLPLNSAIAFPTEEMEEYNMWTKATAHDAGWSWRIPVRDRTGNGYVFCDNFISKEQAHQEMEQYYGRPLDIARQFKFDPGRLETFWKGNCIAIGLSSSFVEPLEATSIGSTINQAFALMNFLPSNDSVRFNQICETMFDNIVDYIVAHYLVRREDTPFWKEIKYNLKVPDSLQHYLDMWKHRLPNTTDCRVPWGMFSGINYIPVLYGLNWFDTAKIKDEMSMVKPLAYKAQESINSYNRAFKNSPFVSHKQAIDLIVNGTLK